MTCSAVSRLNTFQAPPPDQVEVVLLGPRYGEAVCVHIGDNRWLAVDSCLYGKPAQPATLFYFDQIGVSPDRLELVCITHWHDDHVRGISELVQHAVAAKVVIPEALQRKEFLVLATRFGGESLTGGAKELFSLYKNFSGKRSFVLAGESKLILKDQTSAGAVEVWAMSPSSSEVIQCLADIGKLIPNAGEPLGKLPKQQPNHLATVLLIKVGSASMLLGADLEQVSHADQGWNGVLASVAAKGAVSTLFKVPHHGSVTAYNPQVWQQMLSPDATALVTPFHSGRSKLPTLEEVSAIKAHTQHIFITTEQPLVRPRLAKPSVVDRELKDRTSGKKGLQQERAEPGAIRCRFSAASGNPTWEVGLYEGAKAL